MNFSLKTSRDRRLAAVAVVIATAWGLAACGNSSNGGSSTTMDAPPPAATAASIPASAGASVPAFVVYTSTLPQNENQEPLLADALTAPVSDTEEPIAV